jgi:uncharacterized protein YukE
MDFKQPENKFQQQILQSLKEKIKDAVGEQQVQLTPLKVQEAGLTNEKHAEELEIMKEKIEHQTIMLNEIKQALEKLNHSVEKLNKGNLAMRRIK